MDQHQRTGRRSLCLSFIWTGLVASLIPPVMGATPVASVAAQEPMQQRKEEGVRPEVGTPLQAAQTFIKAQKFKEALAKIREADKAKDKSPQELYLIARMRGVAAAGAGERAEAITSFESAIASGRMAPTEQLKMIEAVADLYYQLTDYARTIVWVSRYLKEGGTSAQMRRLLSQAYYLNHEYAKAEKELLAEVQADEKAGRTPLEERLQLLASCYVQQKDTTGYAATLEKLVAYYPKKEYWLDLIHRIEAKPGFARRLALDVNRLKFALSLFGTPTEFMEMTQLALQAGLSSEAKAVIDKGFATGLLGAGVDATRHKRLKELASKSALDDQKELAQDEPAAAAAPDGTGLVNIGFAYTGQGQFDKGIELMQRGLRKGGMKHPEDAKLHLGLGYLQSGQKELAIQTLKTVQGTDGTADLARLWVLYAQRST